ncbi:Hsp20/alpha crystallin family protein [Bacteriovorax sp. BSW11_IV]|uniref:Hsp20/alpha crystallin family protein n=1 Tax=Bacteriovorax sp. BSW11_IV TaxID=1353529 RepID=UPI000420394D|nr:Hsp20/alpha crystallin family protein [Bacteriovorax sp. BSW11_IV]
MKLMTIIFIFLSILSSPVYSQDNRSAEEQLQQDMDYYREAMREAIERNRKIMEQMLDSDFFNQLDDDRQNFLKGLDSSDIFKGFGKSFFQNNDRKSHLKWKDSEKERILIVDIGSGEKPLDIKIKDQQIRIKGEVTRKEENKGQGSIHARVYTYSFDETQTLPEDVDGDKATFEQKGSELWIRFPKIDGASVGKEKSNIKNKVQKDKKRPMDPFGLSI